MGRRNASVERPAPIDRPDPDDGPAGAGALDDVLVVEGAEHVGRTAEEELIAFLSSAPPRLQSWARGELAALRSEVDDEGDVEDESDVESEGDDLESDDDLDDDLDDEDDDDDPAAAARQWNPRRWRAGQALVGRWLRSRGALVVVVLTAAITVVVGVYLMGSRGTVPGISGPTTDQASSGATTAPLDPAKVSALMTKISTNPRDVASLSALGDLYFQSGDYATAAVWEEKVLAVQPMNVTALLALGAAEFNQGDLTHAEKHWQQVVKLNPRQAEAHYDLGFLYLSKTPPDMVKVRQEWQTVVQIDPNSAIAKTVSTHLQSLNTSGPSASASTSSSAGAGSSASPSASPSGK